MEDHAVVNASSSSVFVLPYKTIAPMLCSKRLRVAREWLLFPVNTFYLETHTMIHSLCHQGQAADLLLPPKLPSPIHNPSTTFPRQYYHDNRSQYPLDVVYCSPQTAHLPPDARSSCCPSTCSEDSCRCSLRSGQETTLVYLANPGR
jgi:hypothetical protein